MKLNTLTYHDVIRGSGESSGLSTPGALRYKLDWPMFLEHLDRLAELESGPPVVAEDLIRGVLPDRAWALTFDDGGASAVEIADVLARRGWRGHFFVTTGRIGLPGFLDHEGIRTIASQGHVVGTHSVSHPNMTSLPSWEAVLEEWRSSTAVLSELLGTAVSVGSVPGGWYSATVGRAAAAAGLRVLFTSEPVRDVKRIDECLVVGRHAMRRPGSSARAAALAAGSPIAWGLGRIAWRTRGAARALGGRHYEALRNAWLARR